MDLAVHQDKLLNSIDRFRSQEADRASDVGEMRAEIGDLLELTGLNKKAFSMIRALDKLEDDKRSDVFRSFDALRDVMEKRWAGQSTPDMLDGAEDDDPQSVPVGEHTLDEDGDTVTPVDFGGDAA